ncbi:MULTISPECIES: peptidylprolyl isomerase [unclassified Polaribacter]|uniref:peptidylprolyl isomerase n=1 Tax=unclassified Polaribacter TaxID=196858 RepID=UPI0011BE2779|nr:MULTISPECIES: peptidylprolyl isomerase [unclassified Polaribacter]TXD50863.1 peptidylprolyl isomerase [Polaribacter sp. IC063]TXD57688.1 peptidylprolyl isomerase [Polaribacter sp. IC066]
MKNTFLLLTVISILFSCSNIKEKKNTKRTQVAIKTSKGDILVALYNETPKHRDNFIKLVNEGFYDRILWYRVIDSFIIQTGDFSSKPPILGDTLKVNKEDYLVPSEIIDTIFHKRGTLSAAHDGNPDLYSNGSHFVITQKGPVLDKNFEVYEKWINENLAVYNAYHADSNKVLLESAKKAYKAKDDDAYNKFSDSVKKIARNSNNPNLYSFPKEHIAYYKKHGGVPFNDRLYTVFGEVVTGMNVVDSIAKSKTDKYDKPITDIQIISMKIIE